MEYYKVFDSYKFSNRKPPINYEEIIGKEYIVPSMFEYGPTYVFKLQNVFVSPYGVVYKQNKVVPESLCNYNYNINHFPTYIKKRVLQKVKRVDHPCVLMLNPFYENFYHFTTECLTRLYAVIEERNNVSVIVPDESPKFIVAYLNLLGFNNLTLVKKDELVFCKELLLPSQTAHVHKQNPQIITEVSSLLKSKVGDLLSEFVDYKCVYVNRQKAAYRKIVNQQELLHLLEQYSFKVIDFEDFSLAQSIAIMSNTDFLVGIHGAGLTNMMFMNRSKTIMHLIHEGHHDDSFYNLASVMGHDSIFIQGKAANTDPRGVCFDNFSIDVNRVKHFLDHNCFRY